MELKFLYIYLLLAFLEGIWPCFPVIHISSSRFHQILQNFKGILQMACGLLANVTGPPSGIFTWLGSCCTRFPCLQDG